jgi:nucleoside-diphosphate-sugar epimerase
MKVLVTGSSGKLGRALVAAFADAGHDVFAVARGTAPPIGVIAVTAIGEGYGSEACRRALAGMDAVVHCASLTRIDPARGGTEGNFARANADATRSLASAAAAQGLTRFVYISSVSVNGLHSGAAPFTVSDRPNPQSAYSRSKHDAERAVTDVAGETGMAFVIVRPPRIIWHALSGNLAQLAALIRRGFPLPFGAIAGNRRDNVSAHNLIALLTATLDAPGAANQILLVSDGDPLSTRDLMLAVGHHAGKAAKLLPVPKPILRLLITLMPARFRGALDAEGLYRELTGDLRIDIAATIEKTGWRPSAPILGSGQASGESVGRGTAS